MTKKQEFDDRQLVLLFEEDVSPSKDAQFVGAKLFCFQSAFRARQADTASFSSPQVLERLLYEAKRLTW